MHIFFLLYDIASGNDITPCNIIDKPLVKWFADFGNVCIDCRNNWTTDITPCIKIDKPLF